MKPPDTFYLPLEALQVAEDFTVRVDYGDVEELALRLMTEGQLLPLLVRLDDRAHIIVNGHRRRRAFLRSKDLRIDYSNGQFKLFDGPKFLRDAPGPVHEGFSNTLIACRLAPAGASESQLLGMQLSTEGQPLSALEKILLVQRMLKTGDDRRTVIARTCLSRTYVSNALALHSADRRVLELVAQGKLSQRLAVQVLRKHPAEDQLLVVAKAMARAAQRGRDNVLPKDFQWKQARAGEIQDTLFPEPASAVETKLNALFSGVRGRSLPTHGAGVDPLRVLGYIEGFLQGELSLEKATGLIAEGKS